MAKMKTQTERLLLKLEAENHLLRAGLAANYGMDITAILGLLGALLPLIDRCLNRPEPTPAQRAEVLHDRLANGKKGNGRWKIPLIKDVKRGDRNLEDFEATQMLEQASKMSVEQLEAAIIMADEQVKANNQ